MSTVNDRARGVRRAVGAFPGIRRDLLAAFLPLSLAAGGTRWALGLPVAYLLAPAALYLALVGLIVRHPPAAGDDTGLGAANRVTLLRATLVFAVAGLAPFGDELARSGAWWVIGVAALSMILDGADGRLARGTGTTSGFGARFDMELDAFLILALAILVWFTGQVGPWVVLIGALRYLFVGAGRIWRPLQARLPPSRRRQTVCVVQGLALLVCLAPVVPSWLAAYVAGGALSVLTYSFAVDVGWLARRAAASPIAPEPRG